MIDVEPIIERLAIINGKAETEAIAKDLRAIAKDVDAEDLKPKQWVFTTSLGSSRIFWGKGNNYDGSHMTIYLDRTSAVDKTRKEAEHLTEFLNTYGYYPLA